MDKGFMIRGGVVADGHHRRGDRRGFLQLAAGAAVFVLLLVGLLVFTQNGALIDNLLSALGGLAAGGIGGYGLGGGRSHRRESDGP